MARVKWKLENDARQCNYSPACHVLMSWVVYDVEE